MSEYRFTDGNLIILYAIHRQKSFIGQNRIPDYINERVKLCLNTYNIIRQSKPDGEKTIILVVASQQNSEYIINKLVESGVDRNIIAKDCLSRNVTECFDHVVALIRSRTNPPYLYFVGSFWLREIYEAVILSRLKGYRIQFEDAPDNRSIKDVEEEKALDAPRKGLEYYKRKAKDKAIDIVLNRMFPEGKDVS